MARSGRSAGRRAATVAAHGSCSSSIDLHLPFLLSSGLVKDSGLTLRNSVSLLNSVKSSGVVTKKAYIIGVLLFSDKGSFFTTKTNLWVLLYIYARSVVTSM